MTSQPALAQLNHRIAQVCQQSRRLADSVTLLAVSKTRSAQDIAALADQGLRHFGENYLSEALDKQQALADRDLVWHFIGPIQSNKTRAIASA